MSFENPSQIIRSWGLTKNFAAGPTTVDKLVPPTFGKTRTNFVQTWREETLSANLNWGSSNFSYYLPESLRVVSSIFLRIQAPVIGGGYYKPYAGLYAIKAIRLLSAGQEVYQCQFDQFIRDYCESLSDEELAVFGRIYLGHTSQSTAAREFILPILLPNSAYMQRHGHNTRGSGIWPCYTAANRLEVQITMAAAGDVVTDPSNVSPSISGACTIMMHQVDMAQADVLRYSDLRGSYALVNRRITELTSGWQAAGAGVEITFTNAQPVGCVTEVYLCAVPTGTAEAQRQVATQVAPISFKVVADSVTQKDLNTASKVQMELFSNGFVGNSTFNSPGRLCFATHAAEGTHHFSGGYNMQLASNVQFIFKFASGVDYKLYAIQLQRVSIDSLGLIRASLE